MDAGTTYVLASMRINGDVHEQHAMKKDGRTEVSLPAMSAMKLRDINTSIIHIVSATRLFLRLKVKYCKLPIQNPS